MIATRLALDLCCGDKKVSPNFIGFDIRPTKQADVIGNAEDLTYFADSSIHALYCSRALQHVPNDVQCLREVNRILAPDGLVVIEVSKRWNAVVSIVLNRLKIKRHPYTTYHIYTDKQLRQKIADSGLRLVSLASTPTMTPLFRNYLIVAVKGGSIS